MHSGLRPPVSARQARRRAVRAHMTQAGSLERIEICWGNIIGHLPARYFESELDGVEGASLLVCAPPSCGM